MDGAEDRWDSNIDSREACRQSGYMADPSEPDKSLQGTARSLSPVAYRGSYPSSPFSAGEPWPKREPLPEPPRSPVIEGCEAVRPGRQADDHQQEIHKLPDLRFLASQSIVCSLDRSYAGTACCCRRSVRVR